MLRRTGLVDNGIARWEFGFHLHERVLFLALAEAACRAHGDEAGVTPDNDFQGRKLAWPTRGQSDDALDE